MYKRPADENDYSLSVLIFADTSRTVDHGQLGFVAGF